MGLRGGTFSVGYDEDYDYITTIDLEELKFVDDVVVDGSLSWDYEIVAELTVTGPDGLTGTLTVTYDGYEGTEASIVGDLGGFMLPRGHRSGRATKIVTENLNNWSTN